MEGWPRGLRQLFAKQPRDVSPSTGSNPVPSAIYISEFGLDGKVHGLGP